MRLVGSIDAEGRQLGASAQSKLSCVWRGLLPGGGQRMHCRDRGGVVNNALEFIRQSEPLPEPVEHECFEFSRSWGSAPGHGVDIHRRGDHLGENPRTGRRATEVTHELRVRPMSYARDNDPLNVAKNFVQCRAGFWRSLIQLRKNRTRLVVRSNRAFGDVLAIVGNPIGQLMQTLAELLVRYVAKPADS